MTTGSKSSQKEVNTQIDSQNHCFGSPKVSSLQILSLDRYQVQNTHSATKQSVEKSPETINLTENDVQHPFKAPCCCYENAPTNHLLFFEQSM